MQRRSILFIVFLDLLGFGLILPLLPFAAQSFGASSFGVGVLAATFPLLQMFAIPFWGRLSDRIGRRPVILVSVVGSIVAYLIFALSRSFSMLLVSRAVAGVMAANIGVAKAYLADISITQEPGGAQPDKSALPKNMGLYAAAQAMGFLVGPALGGALSMYGVRGPGFAAASFCAISLVFAWTSLSESLPAHLRISREKAQGTWKTLRSKPALRDASVSFFLLTFAFSHMFIAFPFFLQEALGYGGRETGYFFVLLSFIGILVQGVFFGKLARLYGERVLLQTGLLVMAATLVAFPPFRNLSGTLCLVIFVTIGYSLANPALLSLISKSVAKDEQGLAAGVSESLGGLGRVLGPLVAGAAIRVFGVYFSFISSAAATVLVYLYRRFTSEVGPSSTVARAGVISEPRKREMFNLFQRYYKDVDFELFSKDLAEKNFVLMLWDRDSNGGRKLVGFSTILLRDEGGGMKSLFSGDTVLHEDYWGSRILQKGFSRFLAQTKLSHPLRKVYWMLISKGFKTYLLMRHGFPLSYPNCRTVAPEKLEMLKTRFYQQKYGAAFNPAKSLIHFQEPHGAVKGAIAAPQSSALEDPDVRFFIESNPKWSEGDELACIAEIRLRDILYILLKYTFNLTSSRLA